jgi:hypothetical protein
MRGIRRGWTRGLVLTVVLGPGIALGGGPGDKMMEKKDAGMMGKDDKMMDKK